MMIRSCYRRTSSIGESLATSIGNNNRFRKNLGCNKNNHSFAMPFSTKDSGNKKKTKRPRKKKSVVPSLTSARTDLFQWLQKAPSLPKNRVSQTLLRPQISTIISKGDWTSQELIALYAALAHAGHKEQALELLQTFNFASEDSQLHAINGILLKLCMIGNAEACVTMLRASQAINATLNVASYTIVMKTVAMSGSKRLASTAFDLYREMQDRGIKPTVQTYTTLVTASAAMSSWPLVREYVSQCLDQSRNSSQDDRVTMAGRILQQLSDARKGIQSLKVFKYLIADGIPPDVKIYNYAIAAAGRSNRIKDAEYLFEHCVRNADLSPNLYTYNVMINAYGVARLPVKATEMFKRITEAGMTPDNVSVNSLLYAYGLGRALEDAKALFVKYEDGHDITTLNTMIYACGQSQDVQGALEVFKSIDSSSEAGIRVDKISFENMMEAYATSGAWEDLISFWKSNKLCRRRAKSHKSLHLLLRACYYLEDLDTASDLLKEFEQRGIKPRVTLLNYILGIQIKKGYLNDAISFLKRFERGLIEPNEWTYTTLIKALSLKEGGEYHEEIMRLFRDFWHKRAAVRENPNLSFKDSIPPPCSMLILLVMEDCLAVKDFSGAYEVYQALSNAEEEEAMLDGAVKKLIYRYAILANEGLGDWAQAVTLYDSMLNTEDIGHDDLSYEAVLRVVAGSGQYEAALEHKGGSWYRDTRTDKGWF